MGTIDPVFTTFDDYQRHYFPLETLERMRREMTPEQLGAWIAEQCLGEVKSILEVKR